MKSRKSLRWAALFFAILSLSFYGCGKKGDPRPSKSASSYLPAAIGVRQFTSLLNVHKIGGTRFVASGTTSKRLAI
jgi:hypothetical protein